MFDEIVHADWSTSPKKRMMAVGKRYDGKWHVSAPVLVPPSSTLLDNVFHKAGRGQRVLLGFDFPIGLPAAYADQLDFADFPTALAAFGRGDWRHFFDVANNPADVSLQRPFYPHTPKKGVTRATLVTGLAAPTFDVLLRQCERKTATRPAACSLFWTLGGNAVGKAAIAGWREIVQPGLVRGARLWPFAGSLADLAQSPGCVISETYPGEAYHHVGVTFRRHESKTRQADRASKAQSIIAWADRNIVQFDDQALAMIQEGRCS